jgi:hypothetical protein
MGGILLGRFLELLSLLMIVQPRFRVAPMVHSGDECKATRKPSRIEYAEPTQLSRLGATNR